MIRHVVSWKLNVEGIAEKHAATVQIRGLLEGLRSPIPEIKALTVGENAVSVARNWDLVLIADYESPADLQTYLEHPEHLKVAAVITALVAERSAVDVEF